jgi:hypothetical protein
VPLPALLVMWVVRLPTFTPSPLRDAWGLVEYRSALLRVVGPSALLRAAGLRLADHDDRTWAARGPGVLERPRVWAYAGRFRTHVTSKWSGEAAKGHSTDRYRLYWNGLSRESRAPMFTRCYGMALNLLSDPEGGCWFSNRKEWISGNTRHRKLPGLGGQGAVAQQARDFSTITAAPR